MNFYKKYSSLKLSLIIAAIAALLRIAFFFIGNASHEDKTWEYGSIAKNVIEGKGYSLFYFEADSLCDKFKQSAKPYPSAYMPPGYTSLILPAMAIDNVQLRNFAILLMHLIINTFTCIILFKLAEQLFSRQAAVISCLAWAMLPEFIYSATRVGPTEVYHLWTLIVLYMLSRKSLFEMGRRQTIILAFVLGLILFVRSEPLLFIAMLALTLLFKKQFAKSAVLLIIPLLMLLPWQAFNYNRFGVFVPLTTSGGINFYRGSNQYEPGVWGDEKDSIMRLSLPRGNNFEIEMDRMYKNLAIESIKSDPLHYAKNLSVKFVDFWFVNTRDSRTLTPVVLAPWALLLLFAVYGFASGFNFARDRYALLMLAYQTIAILAFFALPRYQTMMKIILIPWAAQGVLLLARKLKLLKAEKE